MIGEIADLFSKLTGLGAELIEDKDKAIEFRFKTMELENKLAVAMAESKTIPWVDALHKMSRPLLGFVVTIAPCVVLIIHPDVPMDKLMIAVGGGAGVSGLYTAMKGRGK